MTKKSFNFLGVTLLCFSLVLTMSACKKGWVTTSLSVSSSDTSLASSTSNEVSALKFKDTSDFGIEPQPIEISGNIFKQTNIKPTSIIMYGKELLLEVQGSSGSRDGYDYCECNDEYHNSYQFYLGTNILTSYRLYTYDLKLGEKEVDVERGMKAANNFLTMLGYDTTRFSVSNSGPYSNEFEVFYKTKLFGIPTSEQLYLSMELDQFGNLYVTNFSAVDYKRFQNSTPKSFDKAGADARLKKQLETQGITGVQSIDSYLWVDKENRFCMRSLVTYKTLKSNAKTETYIETYM